MRRGVVGCAQVFTSVSERGGRRAQEAIEGASRSPRVLGFEPDERLSG